METISTPKTAGAPDTTTTPPVVDPKGNIILQGRVSSPADVISAYAKMYNDDRDRSYDRSLIQEMLHNFPQNQEGGAKEGKAECSNVNWGDAEKKFEEECAPYLPLPFANSTLFTTPLKKPGKNDSERIGTPIERSLWEGIIAEEATRTFRSWEMFAPYHLQCIAACRADGLSFYTFDDVVDWRPRVLTLENLKFPNGTKIGNIKQAACEIRIAPDEIYQKIKHPESAEKLGWDVAQAKIALMQACPAPNNDDLNWEKWELHFKNKEITLGDSTVATSPWIFFWDQETNGTCSQYITRKEDSDKPFIYKKVGKYASMKKWIHAFMHSIPLKGTYHEIRGDGHRLYSKAMEVNRKINKFSDLTEFDSTPILETDGNVSAQDMEIETFGMFEVMPPGYKVPNRQIPDYSRSIIPGIQFFQGLLNNATSRPSINPDGDTPKHLMDAYLTNQAQTSSAGEMLYYQAVEGLYREMFARLSEEHYDTTLPGGREAADFRARCHDRGVPIDVIYQVDLPAITVVRVIGGGNANVREMKLQAMSDRAQNLDPVGKNLFEHDLWAASLGEQAADRYCPITDTARLPQDASIAQNENAPILAGEPIQVLDGQDDEVHAQMHLMRLGEINEQIVQQQVALPEVTPSMRRLVDHTIEHLQRCPINSPSVQDMIDVADSFEATVLNGEKQLLRLQQAAEREMEHNGTIGANGEQIPQGPNPEEQQAQAKAQQEDQKLNTQFMQNAIKSKILIQDMQHKARMHELEAQTKERKANQDIRIADLKAAADLIRNAKKQQQALKSSGSKAA
jgi:hypothetical protein